MRRPQWLEFLGSLGLEFWLPLPLLGLGLWLVTGSISDRNLSRPQPTMGELRIARNVRPSSDSVLLIHVKIKQNSGVSLVRVKQATRVFQKQEFELSTTELARVEVEIAKKLDLSVEEIRQLARYQVED
ncbi:hypothetical protein NIES593_19875 [Hydrococcus rivularis NIES-593]|uniref:Uncharacterized protein n=1 Tax=Hydrococcus rivularis NIES-593 TaxID=1921803 RepID=A0A1U7H985_9CYAN|nr:hypothetical protein [Hydrococcus rivularis]OKH20149.1 hypothetical protein NIES593_19875 [Hydrococcus rivularis NIES-593]